MICEFNPFHNGHKFLMQKIKEQYGKEIVCIMSGNFVQRGDMAITDKYQRAQAALQKGADLVAELPTAYAVSSARVFAENGIRIAAAMHCESVCFGAENDLSSLTTLADMLESDEVNRKINALMQEGMYYPKALSMAIDAKYAQILAQPNNALALEYIRACRAYGIKAIAVPRIGVRHNEMHICGDIASATKIRELITAGEDYCAYTPMRITNPTHLKTIEPAVLYRLKTITPEELSVIADVSEGLEYRICEVAKQNNSLEELLTLIKTKRYTMARIRRILLSAFLGITEEIRQTPVPYLRILGVRSGKENIFSAAELPLVVKTRTDYEKLDKTAKKVFEIDLRAAEAMNIARGGNPLNEFTQAVIKLV